MIIGTWFNAMRISSSGELIWSYEHDGLVSEILPISSDLIAVIGRSPAGQNPASVVLLEPNSEPYKSRDESFDYEFSNDYSNSFDGGLSDDEIARAEAPPDASIESDSLMDALGEELRLYRGREKQFQRQIYWQIYPLLQKRLISHLLQMQAKIKPSQLKRIIPPQFFWMVQGLTTRMGKIQSYAWQDSNGNVIGNSSSKSESAFRWELIRLN